MKRFLVGFAIGATASAAVVLATTPRSGAATRQQIAQSYQYARQRMTETIQGVIAEGRMAAEARERELWAEFHRRLEANKQKDA